MTPLELLRKTVTLLQGSECDFALAGGLAADLYRSEPRVTKDVDILILGQTLADTQKLAAQTIEKMGLHPGFARSSDLSRAPSFNKKQSPIVMVIGRSKDDPYESGLDFLLPRMPWVSNAIERAQWHKIQVGSVKIPVITIEDLIIAKTFALMDNPSRNKDIDDLQSIFQSKNELDELYLVAAFEKHELTLLRELEALCPKTLRRASKRNRK